MTPKMDIARSLITIATYDKDLRLPMTAAKKSKRATHCERPCTRHTIPMFTYRVDVKFNGWNKIPPEITSMTIWYTLTE